MTTIKHIVSGVKIVRLSWPLIAVAFLFKFGLAFLCVIPLQNLMSDAFSYRPAAGLLLEEWNLTPLIDFLLNHLYALKQYGYFAVIGMILALTLNLFLSGGFFRTLAVAQGGEYRTFTAERFFGWCGRYFWTFLKIAAISAIFYVVIAFLFIILSHLGMHLILSDFTPEPVTIFVALGQLILLLLLLLFINMIMTYVKIAAVSDDEDQILNALGETIRFLSKNLGKATALYGGLIIGILVFFGISWALQKGCGLLPTALTIIAIFIIQQALSLTRSWYRLVGYASQINLYQNCRAPM
jgi:hypothetical protein